MIGTGSALEIVDEAIQRDPTTKAAVIDKDRPGGICLTKGCIPSKILLYPAEMIRNAESLGSFGVHVEIGRIDFRAIMERMRRIINKEIDQVRKGLTSSKKIDYYQATAEFTGPYTLKVGNETITSKMIILCSGSRPVIPAIQGLGETGYLTSDTVLDLTELPKSLVIIGGGYIAAEYGHFFSAMGSKVTIIGRNQYILPEEEPEISTLAKKEFEKHMTVLTNHEVTKVEKSGDGLKRITALDIDRQKERTLISDEILLAVGRGPNTDILHPEKAGIKTGDDGFIIVDQYQQTSQPDIWALGDADGKFMFKHVANYESSIVYNNAILKRKIAADYHAVPHAVFSYPEIASVGLKEREALARFGSANIAIGLQRYEDTAKGEAMNVKDYFVKIIIEKQTLKILGAHIIGPYASVLIHEIINLMNTPSRSAEPIFNSMYIHPALNEVVNRAFRYLVSPEQYHHVLEDHYGLKSA